MIYTLKYGDAIAEVKKLTAESVDAVIMDPPYCAGGYTEATKQSSPKMISSSTLGWFVNDNMTTGGLVWLLRELMIEFHRVVKVGGSVLVFCDWRMVPHLAPALESSGLQYRNEITWDKLSAGMGNGFRPRGEKILHFVKGKPVFYNRKIGTVITCKRITPKNKKHPTEKPQELLKDLLSVVSKEGDVILDPFMGSGSMAEASLKAGRQFIGIDRSEHYVDVARRRVEQLTKESNE